MWPNLRKILQSRRLRAETLWDVFQNLFSLPEIFPWWVVHILETLSLRIANFFTVPYFILLNKLFIIHFHSDCFIFFSMNKTLILFYLSPVFLLYMDWIETQGKIIHFHNHNHHYDRKLILDCVRRLHLCSRKYTFT